MPTTSKMGFLYPAFQQKPFWDTWEAFMSSLDASIWAAFENDALLIEGGGTISLNTGTDELSWTDDIRILDLVTGGMVTIVAGTLAGVEDGKIVYCNVSRPIVGTQTATLAVADTLGNDVNKVWIAIRRLTDLVLRPQTGYVLPVAPLGDAIFSDIKRQAANGGSIGASAPCWFPRQLQVTEDNPLSDLVELMSWDIIGLDDGGGGGPYVVTVAGDQVDHFPTNHLLDISGSTDNDNAEVDERYQIVSAVLSSGDTNITVTVPVSVTFNPATPDGKVYTGRFQFSVAGKYMVTGECSQAMSGGMTVRVANVDSNTYGSDGEISTQVGAVSRYGVGERNPNTTDAVVAVFLSAIISVTAGDIFEVQQYFEAAPATAAKAMGQAKTSIATSDEEVFARIRIKRAE